MSPASKGSKKPAVPVSKVPSVRELCELLGFQRASLKDTNIFMDTAHNWRKSYTTSNGQPATQLLLWNQSSVQVELQAMAEKFLDDEGNGERFWSSTRTWSQDSDLQFPEDRARIVELMKQLFWKQNRYAFNNTQYGHKATESIDGPRDNATPVRQSVETNSVLSPSRASAEPRSPQPGHPMGTATSVVATDPKTGPNHPIDDRPTSKEIDIYKGPDDSDDLGARNSVGSLRSPKRGRTEQTTAEDTPTKKKKHSLPESTPKRMDRKRHPRNMGPHHLIGEELEELDLLLKDTPSDLDDIPSDEQAKKNDQMDSTTKIVDLSSPIDTEYALKPAIDNSTPQKRQFTAPVAPMVAPEQAHKSGQLPKSPLLPPKPLARPPKILIKRASASQTQRSSKPKDFSARIHGTPRRPGAISQIQQTISGRIPGTSRRSDAISPAQQTHSPPKAHADEPTSSTALEADEKETMLQVENKSTTTPRPPVSQKVVDDKDHARRSHLRREDLPQLTNQLLFGDSDGRLPLKVLAILKDHETLRDIYFRLSPDQNVRALLHETMEAVNLPLTDTTRSWLISSMLDHIAKRDHPEPRLSKNPAALETVDSKSNAMDMVPQVQSTAKTEQQSPPSPPTNLAQDSPTHPQPSTQDNHPSQPTNQEASSSKARPKTQIPLWIITREPRYTEERWDEGKFLASTLSVFIDGISQVTQRNNIEKIKLTLRTPTSDTKITVFRDAEDSWISAKEAFIEKLKEASAAAKARRLDGVNCKILVEPFYEQLVLPSGGVEEDDVEFDF